MMPLIRHGLVVAAMLAIILATPAAQAAGMATKAPTIFAAASLKTALDAVAAAWQAQTGTAPVIVYGSSALLSRQIEQGAPADIFISADQVWMDYLAKAGLIQPDTRRDLLGNRLVLVAPADAGVHLAIAPGFDLADAAGNGKIAVCATATCPGGIYARQALENLGVWAQVAPKLAQTDTISHAVELVARGEAAFGIVYATDARDEPKVRIVGIFPDASHSPIVYPVALIAGSRQAAAPGLAAWLASPAAGKIWRERGFTVLGK